MQDIAYATPGRNRLAGFEGHNGTVDYIVKTLEALGDYYDIELQTFTFEVPVGYTANLTVNDSPYEVANLEYGPPGEFNDVELVPVANFGCNAVSSLPCIATVSCDIGELTLVRPTSLPKSAARSLWSREALALLLLNRLWLEKPEPLLRSCITTPRTRPKDLLLEPWEEQTLLSFPLPVSPEPTA